MDDLLEMVRVAPLKSVCDMFTGIPVSPKQFEAGGAIKVVSIKDTDADFNLDIENLGRADLNVNADKLLCDGDVLVKARSHDFSAITLARRYSAPTRSGEVIAGPSFIVMRPHGQISGTGQVDSAYLAWIMNNMKVEISKLVSGSAILQLNIKTLEGLEIPVPSMDEQEKIIAAQDELDAARKIAADYFANIEDLMVGKLKSAINKEQHHHE